MARIAAIFSLSCGAVVDLASGRYAGKAQGESSLFRTIWDVFRPGDIVLTDALLCTWAEIQLLMQRAQVQLTNWDMHLNLSSVGMYAMPIQVKLLLKIKQTKAV